MKDIEKKLISASEVASLFNVSYQTLNYYTNLGLLSTVKKEGNKRLYSEDEVRESLGKIQDLKNQGYPLRVIRTLIQPK